jgi:hypothetical protein
VFSAAKHLNLAELSLKYVCLVLFVWVILSANSQIVFAADKQNTLPLQGPAPLSQLSIPGLPPDHFSAYCSVLPGLCVVRGNGVIPPGTSCHCGEYSGQTW